MIMLAPEHIKIMRGTLKANARDDQDGPKAMAEEARVVFRT
jgi:hypothetical protein